MGLSHDLYLDALYLNVVFGAMYAQISYFKECMKYEF